MVTDACSHSITATQTVKVKEDNADPVADNLDLGTLAGCNTALPSKTTSIITATDDCGGVTIATPSDWVKGTTTNCIVTYTRTFMVTDACSRSITATQTVKVKEDNTGPTFTSSDLTKTITCDQYKALTADFSALKPNATDMCLGAVEIKYVSNSKANLCVNKTFTINWLATDACGKTTTATQTIMINGDLLGATAAASCPVGAGGKIIITATGGCAPYTYKYSCGNGSVNLASNMLTGAASGTYTFTVTDALGCTATTTATLDCKYPDVCTYSQGAFGQPGGMINGITTYEQLKALLYMNPLMVGSGSKSLTLTTAECVDYVLPSSGTSAALSTSFTCPQLPALTNKSVYKNTLLGQCIALSLSVRLNPTLGDLTLGEICGITIPSGFSTTTTVNKLLDYLNAGLGGSKDYNLGTLTNLAGSIITAYDGCRNPCITTFCSAPPPLANTGASKNPKQETKIVNKVADFKVFPVPSDGVVNLDMEDYRDDNIEIKIFNTMSQLIYTQKIQELQQGIVSINLSHLANGAYIISVKAESKTALSKVMIINK